MTAPDPATPDEDVLWVKTEPDPDGKTYLTVINVGDRAWALTPAGALRYAAACCAAATVAEHESAVYRLLTIKTEMPPEVVGAVIGDLRADRPPPDDEATAPLRLAPGVSHRAGSPPFIALWLDDRQIGQWDPADARQHGMHVLEVTAGADLDAALHRYLVGTCEVPDGSARAMIEDLSNYRDTRPDTV